MKHSIHSLYRLNFTYLLLGFSSASSGLGGLLAGLFASLGASFLLLLRRLSEDWKSHYWITRNSA